MLLLALDGYALSAQGGILVIIVAASLDPTSALAALLARATQIYLTKRSLSTPTPPAMSAAL